MGKRIFWAPAMARTNSTVELINREGATMLRDVGKQFGAHHVLKGINLDVPHGKRMGIIGPAACGKSVIAKLWCGLLAPTTGQVTTLGADLARMAARTAAPIRAQIGMLFQNYALFDFLTVLDNVAFPLLRQHVMPRDEVYDRAALRLRAVGLAGNEAKFPAQLSGGMKKRVGIARATVAAPPLVIYDEPTAGLDPVTTQKMYDLLAADHAAAGGTVIAISSDVLALARFVDEVVFIYDGTVAYRGPAATVEDAPDARVRQFVRGELQGPLTSPPAPPGHKESAAP